MICGHGDEKKALEEKVRRLGLEEMIHFPGFIPYHEIGFGMDLRKRLYIQH